MTARTNGRLSLLIDADGGPKMAATPMTCPCGCGGPVPARRKYACRACWLRSIPKERRREWGRLGALRRAVDRGYAMRVRDYHEYMSKHHK